MGDMGDFYNSWKKEKKLNSRDTEQAKALAKIKRSLMYNGKALCVCATGYGKGHLIKLISKTVKGTMLVVAPRVNLVRDLAQRTGGSIYCASLCQKEIGKVTIATKQSIKDVSADLVILDEAHNYTEEFLETIDAKWIIGLTATPWNNNGYVYNQFFWPKPCYEFGIGKSIDAGYLSPYEIFGSKHAFDVQEYLKGRGDFKESEINEIVNQPKHEVQVKEIVQICEAQSRKKVAVLCANIDHAEKIHNEISKYEDCMIVHSRLKDSHKLIEEYKNNVTRFCVSVGMMSEGTDIPSIDCIVFLRPTKSSRLMVQSAGRGLRLHEDKKHCLLLDYGNVFLNCGLPHNPIIPTAPGRKQEESEFPVRQCEACWYIYEAERGSECPLCGHVTKTERDTEKNLKKSLLEKKEIKKVTVNSSHIYKRGIARNKLPYLTLKIDNKTYHTVFGKQINWLLNSFGRNGCEISYTHPFKIVDIKKL
jgi:hypothetical protein